MIDKERTWSLGIYIAYLVISGLLFKRETTFQLMIYLLFPLACIWFGEEMGNYTGFSGPFRPPITRRSPGSVIQLLGWLMLALPVIALVIMVLSTK